MKYSVSYLAILCSRIAMALTILASASTQFLKSTFSVRQAQIQSQNSIEQTTLDTTESTSGGVKPKLITRFSTAPNTKIGRS